MGVLVCGGLGVLVFFIIKKMKKKRKRAKSVRPCESTVTMVKPAVFQQPTKITTPPMGEVEGPPICHQGHPMATSFFVYSDCPDWICDICDRSGMGERWFCSRCECDFCFRCVPKQVPLVAGAPSQTVMAPQVQTPVVVTAAVTPPAGGVVRVVGTPVVVTGTVVANPVAVV